MARIAPDSVIKHEMVDEGDDAFQLERGPDIDVDMIDGEEGAASASPGNTQERSAEEARRGGRRRHSSKRRGMRQKRALPREGYYGNSKNPANGGDEFKKDEINKNRHDGVSK